MKEKSLRRIASRIANLESDGPRTIKACRSGVSHNFNPSREGSLGPGFYFTTDPERAKKYTGPGGGVVWVEIKFTKPLVGPKKELAASLGFEDHIYEDTGAYDFAVGRQLGEKARKDGHDGIIAHESNGKTDEIVVFDKSAITPIDPPE